MPFSPGCGFAQLLSNPLVSGSSGNGRMHNSAGVQLHDYEDIQWAEEQIIHYSEIASPDVADMVLQKRNPSLA